MGKIIEKHKLGVRDVSWYLMQYRLRRAACMAAQRSDFVSSWRAPRRSPASACLLHEILELYKKWLLLLRRKRNLTPGITATGLPCDNTVPLALAADTIMVSPLQKNADVDSSGCLDKKMNVHLTCVATGQCPIAAVGLLITGRACPRADKR